MKKFTQRVGVVTKFCVVILVLVIELVVVVVIDFRVVVVVCFNLVVFKVVSLDVVVNEALVVVLVTVVQFVQFHPVGQYDKHCE